METADNIPAAMPFEDTGPLRHELASASAPLGLAPEGSAPTAHAIAGALVELMGQAPPPPPGSPPIDLKRLAKRNWIANAMIAIVVAGAGAFAAYKATESRSIDNRAKVGENANSIDDNRKAIVEVTASVDSIGVKVDKGRTEQATLIRGVESLKREAQTDKQTRLEEKVKELERENRRLERGQ